MSHVAPRAVPQGKQAAGMPLKNRVPRTPLGPSVTRMEGIPCSGIAWVCQKSIPINGEIELLLGAGVAYRTEERSSVGL